jgi:hypothetical protein
MNNEDYLEIQKSIELWKIIGYDSLELKRQLENLAASQKKGKKKKMPKKIVWKWQELDNDTSRAQVIGGWIIKVRMFIEGKRGVVMSESMTFVPDRDHEWQPIPPHNNEKKPPENSLAAAFQPSLGKK